MMAGGAGNGSVLGEVLVVKEFFAKGDPFFEEGVIAGEQGH